MEVALRVLQAITRRHSPEPADIAELRRLAPLLIDGPLDEMACDVIEQALKRRARLRNAHSAAAGF